MVLIIESGATKAEWALIDGKEITRFRTPGINVSVMSLRSILEIVADAAADNIGEGASAVDEVRFYGAGLVGSEGIILLDKVFKAVFPSATVAYGSDLLAAAKAGFGGSPGIVAILGTGSNSAFYDGHQIVRNVRPGGFILGDEGGGAALGKAFAADYIKGLMPEDLAGAFRDRFGLSYETIVKNVYRGSNPAGYLASFAPFILENRKYGYVREMIEVNLLSFIRRSLMQYETDTYPVAVIGSFGQECREELTRLGIDNGINFYKFVPAPIEALIGQEPD